MKPALISRRFGDNGSEAFHLTDVQIGARDRIRAKLINGLYATEQIACPLCGERETHLVAEKDTYGLPMKTVVCRDCALVYTNPRLTEAALQEMYKTEYTELDRVFPDSKDYFDLEWRKGEVIFKLLNRHGFVDQIKGGLIVDVGCGAGGVLGYFKQAGFDVLGCDLVPKNLQYGIQDQGLDLHYGGLDVVRKLITDRGQRISLVIYEQVFEHLTDPKAELRALRSFIPDSAILYLGVPGLRNIDDHYDSDFIRYLQLPHLVQFDMSRLTAMLSMCGFALHSGDEVVRALFRPASPVLSLERVDYKATLKFLEAMEKRHSTKALKKRMSELPLAVGRAAKKLVYLLPFPERVNARIVLWMKRVHERFLR